MAGALGRLHVAKPSSQTATSAKGQGESKAPTSLLAFLTGFTGHLRAQGSASICPSSPHILPAGVNFPKHGCQPTIPSLHSPPWLPTTPE